MPFIAVSLSPPRDIVYSVRMLLEPLKSSISRVQRRTQRNPYEGRWNWWYSAIADIMIRSPTTSIVEIAKELDKATNTISMIINTDLFKDYLARRKDQWRQDHDFKVLSKLTEVAELSLDSVAEQFRKKKDQVPLAIAVETMTSTLDRLGYGVKTQPQVAVNVNQNDNRTQTVVVQGVSATALEEARAALRLAESKRGEEYDGRLARHPAPQIAELALSGAHSRASPKAALDGGETASDHETLDAQLDLDFTVLDPGPSGAPST